MAVLSSKSEKNSVAYINGRVYTINKSSPWAEAFIVSAEGKFSAVGSNEEILSISKENQLITYDLHGKFIMPGIHDAHMHVLIAGLQQLSEIDIGMEASSKDIAEKIREGSCACAYAHTYGDWLIANSFSNDLFPDGKPDRRSLDDVYPDTPVLVRGGGGHSIFANTAALERAGYDISNEPESHGSRIVRREDGSLTGELSELAMAKMMKTLPKPALAHVKRALRHAVKLAHRAGVTACQEASATTLQLHALRELDAEGVLQLDFHTHIVCAPEWIAGESKEELGRLLDAASEFSSKHVDTRFVKFILDGVPLPPLFTQCSLDEHGHVDESKILVDDLVGAISKYDGLGMTCKIHCTGRGSTRAALDAIALVRERNPHGPFHEIAHCNSVHEGDFSRFPQLRVTAEMSPAMFFAHPATAESNGLMDWNFAKMQDVGALITIGSDWGVPPDPSLLPHLAEIVERVGRGSKELGGELLCRIMTLSGAEAVGKEKESGSIEIGKKANFIALNQDLSRGEFAGAHVLKTWFEGELVWDS